MPFFSSENRPPEPSPAIGHLFLTMSDNDISSSPPLSNKTSVFPSPFPAVSENRFESLSVDEKDFLPSPHLSSSAPPPSTSLGKRKPAKGISHLSPLKNYLPQFHPLSTPAAADFSPSSPKNSFSPLSSSRVGFIVYHEKYDELHTLIWSDSKFFRIPTSSFPTPPPPPPLSNLFYFLSRPL